jgi:hypothetical protein
LPPRLIEDLHNILRLVFTPAAAARPALTEAERTKRSWASAVESYAAVPDVYKDFFEPFLADGREFPRTVLTPSREGFIHRTTEKLVCDFGSELYILERDGNTFTVQCYPHDRISFIEEGTELLGSWIKISGVTGDGAPTSTTFKFNSVTDYLFTPILDWLRGSPASPKEVPLNPEFKKFSHLILVNLKFMNYAKRSLLPGEKVIQTIYQPEIRVKKLSLPGKVFYKTLSPAHMSILTDRELIIIREDARRGEDMRYGGIRDYIPLSKIVSLSQRDHANNLREFSIHLPENVCLDLLLQADARSEIDQLIGQFKMVVPPAEDLGERHFEKPAVA